MSGPFAGMKYIGYAQGSVYIPKLLGSYERELNQTVEAMLARCPGLVIDIGAAEGYYAIGVATRSSNCEIIAFETDPAGQDGLREMALLNHVSDRVSIRGKCDPADLKLAMHGKRNVAITCDVEGYELTLLDPVEIPELREAAILVELHDFVVHDITETIRSRFESTHRIHHIWQEAEPRSPADFPWRNLVTAMLPRYYLNCVVSEMRPTRMAWFWMEPRC